MISYAISPSAALYGADNSVSRVVQKLNRIELKIRAQLSSVVRFDYGPDSSNRRHTFPLILRPMDSFLSLEDVRKAIHVLNHDPDNTRKEKASAWLGELQKSVIAWKLSDELLQQNNLNVESYYFAAQTLRSKIQFSFHELPSTSHHLLRDSLIQHILCLALADLALQMASWKMSTRELIEKMRSNTQLIPALLEIVTMLPEEVNNTSLRLGKNRRDEIRDEFDLVGPNVLQLLVACTESFGATDSRLQTKILKCLAIWLGIGALPTVEVAHSKLLIGILGCLAHSGTSAIVHEAASDCICEAMCLIEGREKNIELRQALFQGVHGLREAYHLCVVEEDNDKCVNYCRMFTELAESLLKELIETPGQGLGSLQTLDSLYIERLITALCRQCQMEPDSDGILEEQDDFAEFREKVSELIKQVVFIVGPFNYFQQMYNNLSSWANNVTWDVSEACLFVMSAIARTIPPNENEVIPRVMHAILNLPVDTHVAVYFTSIQLVGEFREWIEKHPQSLEPILNFLFKCFHQPQLATVAATALRDICIACTDQMGLHFNGLLHIVRNMQLFNISDKAAVGLLKGTVSILRKLPVEVISEGVMQLCRIQTDQLLQKIKDDGSLHNPIISLDRLAAIFRSCNLTVVNGQTHPFKAIVQEVWPIVSETCFKFQSRHVFEKFCSCIRFMVRCVGRQSEILIDPLVSQIIQLYQVHQNSCFLYLGSILVDEFGMDQAYHKGLLGMLEAFCGPTFKLLDGPNNLQNYPDTVEDFFRLCCRFLQRIAVPFLQSSMFKSIFQCGFVGCALDHREANETVMNFFCDLIKCHHIKIQAEDYEIRRKLVTAWLIDQGALLISHLIKSTLCLPTFMISYVADVIFELLQYDIGAVSLWLEETLKVLPTQSSGGCITATHKQLAHFHKAVIDGTSANDVRTFRNCSFETSCYIKSNDHNTHPYTLGVGKLLLVQDRFKVLDFEIFFIMGKVFYSENLETVVTNNVIRCQNVVVWRCWLATPGGRSLSISRRLCKLVRMLATVRKDSSVHKHGRERVGVEFS
uniref:Importin N-terminal domain-containing protein n=1 Tax=Strigamia maritima TaxID=126957 RepID=T1J5F3_STRMM